MKQSSNKRIGDFGERRAALYLLLHGYWILERNYRTGPLELDIIALRGRTVVFVEVKTRSYLPEEISTAAPPGTAVNREKQKHTRRAALEYLHTHRLQKQPRMDVIEIWLDKTAKRRPRVLKLRHIKGAY